MSAPLQPKQFYEVGEPGQEYDASDKVAPEHYGLRSGGRIGAHTTDGLDPSVSVPLSSLRAVQTFVFKPHVENLATVPAHELAPPVVYKRGDEHLIYDGHHRVAAAAHRGESHMNVYLGGTTV